MLANHAGFRLHALSLVKRLHHGERDGGKRKALHRRGLAESGAHRWHCVATFLTMMMTVRGTTHRLAALHRLFGRCHAAAIGRIRRDRNHEHSRENSSSETHPE